MPPYTNVGYSTIDRLNRIYNITTSSGQHINEKVCIDLHYIRQIREIYAFLQLTIPPTMIFNIDETQILTASTRQHTKSINGLVGQVHGKPNKEGRVLALLCGTSASGRNLDIVVKYKGMTQKAGNKFIKHPHNLHLIPSDSRSTPWINHDDIMNYIHQYIVPITNDQPSLLLVDHANHYNNLIENQYIIMHNIKVLYVPARCTGLTQPLDVGVFGPVKSSMYRKRDDYIRMNPSAPLYTEVNMLEWFYDSSYTIQHDNMHSLKRAVISSIKSIIHQNFTQIYAHTIALYLFVCCISVRWAQIQDS